MSKRQADIQIHNQPMTEAENRAANMMNNQPPTKATPAQLAQRKIREAKGSARRRNPATSPAPTGPAFSSMQSTPFFPGANTTTPAFGANGVNAVQQQSFAAPSSGAFSFSASTGTNPFAALGTSNTFSTPNSSTQFGNQASGGTQQGSVFGQAPTSQVAPNPFAARSTFNFGQSSGLNNSFPQNQNTSTFSKSTSASSSFTFGSNPNPSQAPIFGATAQTFNADNDVSMEASESPFKSPAKSALPDQSAKPAPLSFRGSGSLSFTPTNQDTSQGQNPPPSQSFGSQFHLQTSTAEQQAQGSTSSIFQLTKPTESKTASEQPSQSSAPIFNFFPKTTEPEKPSTTSSTAFKPFASLESAETQNKQDAKPASAISFGTSSGPSEKDANEKSSEQTGQDGRHFNPPQSLQTGGEPNAPYEQKTSSNLFQSSQLQGSTRSNPLQSSDVTESGQTQASAPLTAFQPSKSVSTEKAQTAASFNPFKSLNSAPAGKAAYMSTQSSEPTSNLFQAFKSTVDGSSKPSQTPAVDSSNHVSPAEENVGSSLRADKDGSASLEHSASASALTSGFKNSQSVQNADTSNGVEQSKGSGAGEAKKSPSETSKLFARSLEQTPVSATKNVEDPMPTHSQSEQPRLPSAKPILETQQKVDGTAFARAASPLPATQPLKVKVKSLGALNVPQELNNDEFADFDKSYRLRSLNARFQKHIAELNPVTHDFEPVIRFYATQRAAIGYPMGGLYHRVKAGEKRKTEQADRVEAASSAAKRTKLDTPSASSVPQVAPPVFGFSAITSVSTTPQPAMIDQPRPGADVPTSSSLTNTGSKPHPATSTSDTSNVFKSMLSSSKQPSFGSYQPLQPSSSHSETKSTAIASKPAEQQAKTFAPSSSTPTNKSTTLFQASAPSNGFTTTPTTTETTRGTSQLFQPKAATSSSLEAPKFAPAAGTDFMAAFAAQAKKNAAKMEAENKAKRKAEEFDSDEDDEAEYERRAAEEDRAKRAKIEAIAKAGCGFTPVLSSASSVNGASPAAEQDGESTRDASGEGSAQSEEDESESDEGRNEREAEEDEGDDDLEEEESDDDDIQTAMAKSHAKAKNPFASSSDPSSLFNRITKPDVSSEEQGSKIDSASPPAQIHNSSVLSAPPGTGLFGSRPSTPNLDSPNALGSSILSNPGSSTPTGDNTWKPGSAIKFGGPAFAPTVNITPATPLPKTNGDTNQNPFSTFSAAASISQKPDPGNNDDTPKASSSLFSGSSSPFGQLPAASGTETSKPFSTLFGDASKKTTVNQSSAAHVGFSFGGPNKLGGSSLLAPSNASSTITSRATSPGLTDNDSAAESGPDDQANDLQSDYMKSRPGEENEDVLFEVRTKVLEYKSESELSAAGSKDEPGWKSRGLGPLRVLRNRETARTRIVMRSEPGANVIVNAPLIPDNNYDVTRSGKEGASLKTTIFMDGKLKNWVFKIKTVAIANDLVECLQDNSPESKKGQSS